MDTPEGAPWWIDLVLNHLFPPTLNRLLDDWEQLCLRCRRLPSTLARARRVSGMLQLVEDDVSLRRVFQEELQPQDIHAMRHALHCLRDEPLACVLLTDQSGFGDRRLLLPIVSCAIANAMGKPILWDRETFLEREYGYDD